MGGEDTALDATIEATMTVFIFDVETTTGVPNFKLPADHPDQPYICEVAALLMDGPGSVIGELDTLIKPGVARWEIDGETEAIHHISTYMCKRDGRLIDEVLAELTRLMDQADVVAGYSVDFDLKMFRGACRRASMDDRYAVVKDKRFDVMRAVKPLCKVKPTPGMRQKKGFKMPKLVEAVEILLKRDHKGAHRAMADCRATAELYWYVNGEAIMKVDGQSGHAANQEAREIEYLGRRQEVSTARKCFSDIFPPKPTDDDLDFI